MIEHADRSVAELDPNAVAVVGMAGRFPGAPDVDAFWRNLRDGVESIRHHSDEELRAAGVPEESIRDPDWVGASSTLDDPDRFDASFFGYLPREAEMMDPQHRHFLECAWEALESAGYDSRRYPGRIGVFGGVARNTYLLEILRRDPEHLQRTEEYLGLITGEKDFPATRVGYKLDLRGPCVNVQTACSTSGVAIHLACQSLLTGESDMALAGGGRILVPLGHGYRYEEGGILSPDGRCRAFDADARGTIRGSGMAFVVLKRLEDAVEDGDFVHAVIRGTAVNNDGAEKVGFTAPGVGGQAEVVAEALAVAGVDAATIDYLEAHGTATPVGDPIEVAALTRAFRETTDRTGYCALGSVKTNIGHLDAGAAVTGLIKAVLCLRHGQIPPSLHYREPNPQIDFEGSPFFVNDELREWPRRDRARRAGVSSFGLGGTNFHAVLEEAPEASTSRGEGATAAVRNGSRQPSDSARSETDRGGSGRRGAPELLLLSARDEAALGDAEERLSRHLDEHPEQPLDGVAWTLRHGRRQFRRRAMVVARDAEEAAERLRTDPPGGEERFHARGEAPDAERPVVFLFPGGGSQHVGMGRDLYHSEPLYRGEMERCLDVLEGETARRVRKALLEDEPDDPAARKRMEAPSVALPALFATEHALARLAISRGVRPDALMGHSVGEYAAACVAGVFSPEDAMAVVALRGRLFEELPPGAMAAVPLPGHEVRSLGIEALSVAAENVPSACVASGTRAAIDELERRLAERGMECRRLHIEVAAHSELVEPVLERFREFVSTLELHPARIPVLSNLSGDWADGRSLADPGHWVRHLRETVRFSDGVERLLERDAVALLEVGPGRTLSSFVRMNPAREDHPVVTAMRHPTDDLDDQGVFLAAVGRLWTQGAEVDWEAFDRERTARRVPLPTYPFRRTRHWAEALEDGPPARAPAPHDEPAPRSAAPESEPVNRSAARVEAVRDRDATRGAAMDRAPPLPPDETPGAISPATMREIIEDQMETMQRQLQLLGGSEDDYG